MNIINDFKLLQLIQSGTWQIKCDVQFKGELQQLFFQGVRAKTEL